MTLAPAPLFTDVAPGPESGAAHWVTASDGVRLRVGVWREPEATRGTVLLFPGRTEYIEKYGETAAALSGMGLATLAVDWRGQGLADRLLEDPDIGHVGQFSDYQMDVAAVLRAARELDLPRPFHLIAHSMGGAIGLRAVIEGLTVQSCVFSGPMWGIRISPAMRPVAWTVARLAGLFGQSHQLMPTTSKQAYVLEAPFADNQLTTDPDMYAMMQAQLAAHPELSLGGPSIHWLSEAVTECRHLTLRQAPRLPCLTILGSNERIVDTSRIHDRMARWSDARLYLSDGAEHEIFMERADLREPALAAIEAHFTGYTAGGSSDEDTTLRSA